MIHFLFPSDPVLCSVPNRILECRPPQTFIRLSYRASFLKQLAVRDTTAVAFGDGLQCDAIGCAAPSEIHVDDGLPVVAGDVVDDGSGCGGRDGG